MHPNSVIVKHTPVVPALSQPRKEGYSTSGAVGLIWLILCMLPCGFSLSSLAQSQPPVAPGAGSAGRPAGGPAAAQQVSGSISGTIFDQSGAVAVGAQVRLTGEDQSPSRDLISGDNGQFYFANVTPGLFRLTISGEGFATQEFSGVLGPGEPHVVPPIMLALAAVMTEVQVGLTQAEVAEVQLKEEEKQRVFGFIPNFYVSYVPNAAPLTPKQKFGLAWKSTVDPFTFVAVGALAGLQQAADDFSGYGQGAEGYGKRYGASYADVVAGTFIGSAVLPSLLKQDPRYFYKGTGSTRSRILYALANSVICKGDNKRWQPNYSGILGSLAAGGISYLYYPASDRKGAGLVFQGAMFRVGGSALAGIFQEFVVRKLTPRLPDSPAQP